ncbi:hypothetical protein CBR_g537 [Chara braunii]|uniref:Uncharacterized protein n=1 Tax=Chara braunii TaxID=69332 RepID=A0A388KBJ7_CHABU|nr:hypothetical protein CBR_g537 [Chara braunii]|eukprot:GBG67401.1 hypothetical protein CBR_g537 [Chara braunii]
MEGETERVEDEDKEEEEGEKERVEEDSGKTRRRKGSPAALTGVGVQWQGEEGMWTRKSKRRRRKRSSSRRRKKRNSRREERRWRGPGKGGGEMEGELFPYSFDKEVTVWNIMSEGGI